jgi:hypothetical protein
MHPLEGRLELKLFVESRAPDQREIVPVFHGWIRDRLLPDELLIDVADYSHVHHGPGVILVGHRAIYGIDQSEGRPGLLCRQRRPASGEGGSGLLDLFRRSFHAGALLREEPALGGRFRLRNEMLFRVLDRRLARPRTSTWRAVAPELSSFLAELCDGDVRLVPPAGSTETFAVRIELGRAPEPKEVLQAISALQ